MLYAKDIIKGEKLEKVVDELRNSDTSTQEVNMTSVEGTMIAIIFASILAMVPSSKHKVVELTVITLLFIILVITWHMYKKTISGL